MGCARVVFVLLIGLAIGYYVVKHQDDASTSHYPAAVRAGFLTNCEVGGSKSACECALDRLEQKYNLEQFQALQRDLSAGQRENEVLALVGDCSSP